METKKNVKVIQEEQGFVLPKSNQFKETFQRLCENKAALAGMVFLILLISVSICADFLFNYQETCVQQNIMERLQWPSWEHPFGTDEFVESLYISHCIGWRPGNNSSSQFCFCHSCLISCRVHLIDGYIDS